MALLENDAIDTRRDANKKLYTYIYIHTTDLFFKNHLNYYLVLETLISSVSVARLKEGNALISRQRQKIRCCLILIQERGRYNNNNNILKPAA